MLPFEPNGQMFSFITKKYLDSLQQYQPNNKNIEIRYICVYLEVCLSEIKIRMEKIVANFKKGTNW
jgi:hypothetical protein